MLNPARIGARVTAAHAERRWTAAISADLWVLAGITVLAAVLRFATITDQSYWYDEAQAVHEVSLGFGAMLSHWSANEPNPPLYFVLAWPWAKVFGTGEAGLRSLSAVGGVALIPIVWLCGRELVSSRAGLVAAALAAVNPLLIWYSQEAREYMLLTTLCAGSTLLFVRALRAPSGRNLGWWALISALALATQYFAALLVFPEALWLLYRSRSRASVFAVAATAVVEGALLPHAISHASHPTGWIDSVGPLSVRLQQVPVVFALNTVYKSASSLVNYGLYGAALLGAIVIALLLAGAEDRELRGAGIAAALAACVLLIPLGLALVGHDYYEARAMIPAWVPLAIVIAAACTTRRLRAPGALLAVLLLVLFVWAGIRIDDHVSLQRPNWRGVASALGPTRVPRAIVAYDGTFATAPLAIYLPGVAWAKTGQDPQPGNSPATVSEIDVVGNTAQRLQSPLHRGIRLISSHDVDGYLVARFALAHAMRITPSAIRALAPSLLGPAGMGAAVLVQKPVAPA